MPTKSDQTVKSKGDTGSDGTMLVALKADALALGEDTFADLDADVLVEDGTPIDTASVDCLAITAGDALAITAIESFCYSGDPDGSGAGVLTATDGIAVGDGSFATSSTKTKAISNPAVDIIITKGQSYAAGETYHDAEATTVMSGDITAGHSISKDFEDYSWAKTVGIAIVRHAPGNAPAEISPETTDDLNTAFYGGVGEIA